jgi:hypothetical protein
MSGRRIDIDFAPRRVRWSPLALAAIAALVAAGAVLAAQSYAARERVAQARAQLAALERTRERTSAKRVAVGVITPERARSVNDAVRRLNLPWQTVFVALSDAAAGAPRIALLTLEPDAASGVVRLAAEARSIDHALVFQKRLEQQPGIRSAVLTKHEVVRDDPQAPVRFWIEARLAVEAPASEASAADAQVERK